MSVINTGILNNAVPSTATRINEMEQQVLYDKETFAYLDENNELCFALPFKPKVISELAWDKAYELFKLNVPYKVVYKKTGLDTYETAYLFTDPTDTGNWRQKEFCTTDCLLCTVDSVYGASIVHYDEDYLPANFTVPDVIDDVSVEFVTSYAFSGCMKLETVTFADSLISIGVYAFMNCKALTSVHFGSGLRTLGNCAFLRCSALTDITYSGTIAQWQNIDKGLNVFNGTNVTHVQCSDGSVAI